MDATKRKDQAYTGTTRRKVVEEPFLPVPPAAAPAVAAAPPSSLVGAIVEKGVSAAAPASLPRPTVLPFPVARHRSHGPHWNPAMKDADDEDEDEMDVDETNFQPVAAMAGPVRRKERKGMDFSRWRELARKNEPHRRERGQAKLSSLKKQTAEVDARNEAPKAGVVVGDKEFGVDDMQLDGGNSGGVLPTVVLNSDAAPKKPMKQVDVRDNMQKAGRMGNVELGGEDMQLDGGNASLAAEIDAENRVKLAGMSAGQIAEAQVEIVERMDPTLVEMLRQRGREKSGARKGGGRDNGGINARSGKAARAVPGDWLTAGEHSGHSWKVWSERVEQIRSCRFALDGSILGFQSLQEQQDGKKACAESVAERDFLRTEGDPAAIGYTINEAVALTRSMVPGQRVLALHLLASILNRALHKLQEMDFVANVKEMGFIDKFDDWQAIWAYALGPEPELVLSLRMALDDNHDSVVLACAKVMYFMLSYDMNETYFDMSEKLVDHGKDICTAPVFRSKPDPNEGFLEGGFWKYNTKPSNILPHYSENDEEEGGEKHTIQDDVVVSGQDVAAGLIRMGILPRICFLLEMDTSPTLQDCLVSILVALARHSPQSADAILNCPGLIQSVVKMLTKQGSMEIQPSQIKGVTLLKVLSKYSRQTCLNFVNRGVFQQAMWQWYRKAFTLEDWIKSGKEQCKLNSAMIIEQLRFWRTCVSYGFCISHFTDFFPVLCLWLSPPMFQKLSESNVLIEFSYVASEAYLLLGALAQRLPLLHSVEQLGKQDMGVFDGYVEIWSWSHVVPMVDLAIPWLHLNDIPYVSSLCNGQATKNMLEAHSNSLVLVVSSVVGLLSSILDRISPDGTSTDGNNYRLPWIPDFVPKIGLDIINNGIFNFSCTNADRHGEHPSTGGLSLARGLCYMRSHGNVDASLSSVRCLQRLVHLSLSVDKVIQQAKANYSEHLQGSNTGIIGKTLEGGISNWCHNELFDVLSLLLPIISSQWSMLQNIQMFGRGGPAPGIGFGWGSCGGGFWSLKCLLVQLDSLLVLDLIKIFTAVRNDLDIFDKNVNQDIMTNPLATDSINYALGISVIAGPGHICTIEKAFDILFQPSVLKCLNSYIHYIASHVKTLKSFKWDITEDEYMHFSSMLNLHFRSRWLTIKSSDKCVRNNNSLNGPKRPEALEAIQEEREAVAAVNPPCSSLAVEWARQRLPLPMHWILSALCCIGDRKSTHTVSANDVLDILRAGLMFVLGLEAIAYFPSGSFSPFVPHVPLVWKVHTLSVAVDSGMDLLQEDRTRDIFNALQELYGQHLDRLCHKYYKSQSEKQDKVTGSLVAGEEAKQSSALQILCFQEKIHGSYTTFVENFVEQFAAVSYGDVIFGRQVAIYLHRSVEPLVRLAAWNAMSNAYVLELLPPLDKCIGDVKGYLEPFEDNERILEAYAKSWTSGVLDKAAHRKSGSFTLAKHHLSCFVFQSSASGKVLRNKLVKLLIRCYMRKRHHEAILQSFILHRVLQDTRCCTEVGRRFDILVDACEGNSSLLGEVEKLRSSVRITCQNILCEREGLGITEC